MGSFVRRVQKRKRCLGEVRVLRREEYQELAAAARLRPAEWEPLQFPTKSRTPSLADAE